MEEIIKREAEWSFERTSDRENVKTKSGKEKSVANERETGKKEHEKNKIGEDK